VPEPTVESIPLALGFSLECSFPSATDELVATLTLHGRALRTMVFRAESPTAHHTLTLGLVRIAVGFDADMFAGELTWGLSVAVRPPGGWRTLLDHHRTTLRFDPSLGEVAAGAAPYPPQVDDPRYGRSQTCTPTILRFHVDEEVRALCRVGSVVKDEMFPAHPPFVFNTVACVGAFPPGGPGAYTDPDSIWFNTFVGYYQLDCAKERWRRPFGYDKADGSRSAPVPDDLVRLGKSDWNWFSNWDYGVPTDVLRAYSAVPSSIDAVNRGLVRVGNRQWHQVAVNGTTAASCYEADAPGAATLVDNTVLGVIWRRGFGGPNPRPNHASSFIPTVVDALVYMSYWEDDTHFHTVIFGGTMLSGTDPEFLEAQRRAVEVVMNAHYPELGFPLP
jgi:hypothetical protein